MKKEGCLIIESLYKEYNNGNIKANAGISATFYPGQITAIVGHNGAGKTTFLNQIIGVVKPNGGEICYQGYSLIKDPKKAREYVSMMPQFHAPLAGVTLRQCIESILYVRCVKKSSVNKITNQILSDLQIEQWATQAGDKLSGGVQRLTSFAMAVACPTPVVLLDEPTNDVDPVRRKLIWQYMRKLANSGHIVIVVTHNLLEVEQYADRYILFDKGKIIQDESTNVINRKLSSSTLTAVVEDSSIIKDIPSALKTEYLENDCTIVMTLSLEQVSVAIEWILKMIKEKKIVNYKLSSASLDISYGGMINEQ